MSKSQSNKSSSKSKSVKKSSAVKSKSGAKVSKVSASVKAVATRPAINIKKRSLTTTGSELLHRLNALHVIISLVAAVATMGFMSRAGQSISTGLVVNNELAAEGHSHLVPAIHYLYELEVRYVLVVIMVLSAIVPLRNILQPKQYANDLKTKTNIFRWLDKAIVGGMMLGVVASLSGVQDFMTLKLVGASIVATALLGWLSERQNTSDTKDWSAYGISILTGTMPWVMIAAYSLGTVIWGRNNQHWYVYALYLSVFLSSIAYALNGANYIRKFKSWSEYMVVERNYVSIDIVNRTLFAVILIVGLHK